MKPKMLLLLPILIVCGCKDMGHGEKVGQIIKLNKQGFFYQTWEAEIIRGGLNNGSGASSTLFNFTIEDPSLVPAVQAALDGQYEVKITYNMEFATWGRSDSGDHFLNRIERLNGQGHALEVKPATDPREQKRQELLRQLRDLGQ